jgi:hypothetical protein
MCCSDQLNPPPEAALRSSKSNFRFTPESSLNPEIGACPKSANSRSGSRGLLDQIAGVARQEKPKRETVERRVTLEILLCGDRR